MIEKFKLKILQLHFFFLHNYEYGGNVLVNSYVRKGVDKIRSSSSQQAGTRITRNGLHGSN